MGGMSWAAGHGRRRIALLCALTLAISLMQAAVLTETASAAEFSCINNRSVPGDNPCCPAHVQGPCTLPCKVDNKGTILHGFNVPGVVDTSTVNGCFANNVARTCPSGNWFMRLFIRRECRYTSETEGSWTCTAGTGQTFLCEIIKAPE